MSDKPLTRKKVAVLVETEYIHEEVDYYLKRVPSWAARCTSSRTSGGTPQRISSTTSTTPTAP